MNKLDGFVNIFLSLADIKMDAISIEEFSLKYQVDVEKIFTFLSEYHKIAGNLKKFLDISVFLEYGATEEETEDINIDILDKKTLDDNYLCLDKNERELNYKALADTKDTIEELINDFKNNLAEDIKEINRNKEQRKIKNQEINNRRAEAVKWLLDDIGYSILDFIDKINDAYNFSLFLDEVIRHKDIYKHLKISIDNNIDRDKIQLVRQMFFNLTSDENVELYRLLSKNNIEVKTINSLIKRKADMLDDIEVMKYRQSSFELHSEKIKAIANLIDKACDVDILTKNGVSIRNTRLDKVVFDDYAANFKLYYIHRGSKESILLTNIESYSISKNQGVSKKRVKLIDKKKIVKFRVFHEFNAKEKAIRFAINYDLKLMHSKDFTDFEIRIDDTNKVLRFARNLVPSVIILEPAYLKEYFECEINSWMKNYEKIGE